MKPYSPVILIAVILPAIAGNMSIIRAQADTPAAPEVIANDLLQEHGSAADFVPTLINDVAVPDEFPVVLKEINDYAASEHFIAANSDRIPYLIMLKHDGTPYYYKVLETPALSFRGYGNQWISYWSGGKDSCHVLVDDSYRIRHRFHAAGPYPTLGTEFRMINDESAWVVATDSRRVDMSMVVAGGRTDARVSAHVVQQIDTAGNLLFEWNAWDHFEFSDAVNEDLAAAQIDFVQISGIDTDTDTNLLVLCRNLDQCLKIDRTTGKILWRFGGEISDFILINDTLGLSGPTDIQVVPGANNHYLFFDNGRFRTSSAARVVEFELDTVNMEATRIWEYTFAPGEVYAGAEGRCQRLSDGNTFISFNDSLFQQFLVVDPGGVVLDRSTSGRPAEFSDAGLYTWTGSAKAPYVVMDNHPYWMTLVFNHFGREDIAYYKVYGGTNSHKLEVLGTTENTWYNVTDLDQFTRYYFKITSVTTSGVESEFSNTVGFRTMFYGPGENMIRNGNFSESNLYWAIYANGTSHASGFVDEDQRFRFHITDGGTEFYHVQLIELHVPLVCGRRYRLEFDAWATRPRPIRVNLSRDVAPWTDYSKNELSDLTTQPQHFSYEFTMTEPTNIDARVAINVGSDTADVLIDNLYLSLIDEPLASNDITSRGPLPTVSVFGTSGNLNVVVSLPCSARVGFEIYTSSGALCYSSGPMICSQGEQHLTLPFDAVPGIYFLRTRVEQTENGYPDSCQPFIIR